MCRYSAGTSHKSHYACFNCQKTFKRRLLRDIDKDASFENKIENYPAKCPECGNLMADMGLDFESPKKVDAKRWNHIKNLYSTGITFHSCGCSGPGYIPKDSEALKNFLEEKKSIFLSNFRFWSELKEPISNVNYNSSWDKNPDEFLINLPNGFTEGNKRNWKLNTEKAIEYWRSKVEEIETYLIKNNSNKVQKTKP